MIFLFLFTRLSKTAENWKCQLGFLAPHSSSLILLFGLLIHPFNKLLLFFHSYFLSFQCQILPSPQWTTVLSVAASLLASKSESISLSPVYFLTCSPPFFIPYFSMFSLITPDGWLERPVAL